MKKLFSLILCLFFILNVVNVNATRLVNYNFKEGKIDNNGNFQATENSLDNVRALGFVCLDERCSNLGEKLFDFNSENRDSMLLRYPTELKSQFGYGVYYSKKGFITWESNPNWFGTNPSDPQGPYNVYLGKKESCSSEISDFKIKNSERANTPVVIDVKANVDTKTKAAINGNGPLEAVPDELKDDYSVKTLVSLNIIYEDNINVFSESKEVLIGFGDEENVNFEFIPEDSGNYNALVSTKVIDEKCLSSNDNFNEKEFAVLEENPLNACYTNLSSLELSSFNVKKGNDLLIKLKKISNFQKNIGNEDIIPIDTSLSVELINEFGESFNEKVFSLESNENSADAKEFELLFNVPKELDGGFYNLFIVGKGNDDRCSNDNKKDILEEEIFVEEDGIFGHAPEIISEPVKKAILGREYFYDVDAIDKDNDKLSYSLLVRPDGMNINSETGLISWHVDEDKFEERERVFVFVLVNDGLLLDAQFFTINIDEDKKEEKEKEEHDFRVSGLDLEYSDNENGIVGFLLLKNDGDFKENKVSVYADIYDLDIHEVLTSSVNLGKEDSFWIPIDIKIPSKTKDGEYLVNVVVGNNKHKEEHRFVVFIEDKNKERVRVITNP